jgi:UPF0716 protein FxsA
VLREVQQQTAAGRLPASPLADAVMILVAAALLVTPGIVTDAFGFLCLVPAFRRVAKRAMLRRWERAVRTGSIQVHVAADDPFGTRQEKVVRDLRDESREP